MKLQNVFMINDEIVSFYEQVALHFWGLGGSALPVVSLLFVRDLCIQIGSDCLDTCLKGIYKAYVLNCQFVSGSKLKHIQFLGNCVIELYRLNLSSSYQHAFIFIRQLAMILRDALTVKTKVLATILQKFCVVFVSYVSIKLCSL